MEYHNYIACHGAGNAESLVECVTVVVFPQVRGNSSRQLGFRDRIAGFSTAAIMYNVREAVPAFMLAETAISDVVLSALVESVDESSLSHETARKNVDTARNQMGHDKIRGFMLVVSK